MKPGPRPLWSIPLWFPLIRHGLPARGLSREILTLFIMPVAGVMAWTGASILYVGISLLWVRIKSGGRRGEPLDMVLRYPKEWGLAYELATKMPPSDLGLKFGLPSRMVAFGGRYFDVIGVVHGFFFRPRDYEKVSALVQEIAVEQCPLYLEQGLRHRYRLTYGHEFLDTNLVGVGTLAWAFYVKHFLCLPARIIFAWILNCQTARSKDSLLYWFERIKSQRGTRELIEKREAYMAKVALNESRKGQQIVLIVGFVHVLGLAAELMYQFTDGNLIKLIQVDKPESSVEE